MPNECSNCIAFNIACTQNLNKVGRFCRSFVKVVSLFTCSSLQATVARRIEATRVVSTTTHDSAAYVIAVILSTALGY